MKILIITYYRDNYAALAEVTNQNKIDYCNYWNEKNLNYTFFPWQGFFRGVLEYGGFYKFKLIKYLFKTTDYDAVFYQDTDTLIMNFTIPIENLMDDEHSFFPTIEEGDRINAGNFIVKNDTNGRKFIDFLEADAINWAYPGRSKFQEQGMLRHYCQQPEWDSVVKIMPHRSFNSYIPNGLLNCPGTQEPKCVFQRGDFLLHFATHTVWGQNVLSKRIELANFYQKDIVFEKKKICKKLFI